MKRKFSSLDQFRQLLQEAEVGPHLVDLLPQQLSSIHIAASADAIAERNLMKDQAPDDDEGGTGESSSRSQGSGPLLPVSAGNISQTTPRPRQRQRQETSIVNPAPLPISTTRPPPPPDDQTVQEPTRDAATPHSTTGGSETSSKKCFVRK
ncbi:MAG: hypothetical protein GY696_16290 [Gammaproteobacteria bacterium]|nr:hypothetical protein [Gammaproteobacteria bacterium]